MVPSTNRLGHRPFKAAMLGSNPAGITIFRIGVTVAHLTLTQEAVVQIHRPVPHSSVVKTAITPDCLSGDRGQGELPLAAREGGLGRSSPVGVAIWPLSLTG